MKHLKIWSIERLTGYKPITTFWEDFTIAEQFGRQAIEDTFERAFNEWKHDYRYLTELVMVLNWKLWEWYLENEEFGTVYNNLWAKADDYACETLKGEELAYFYRTTD